MKRIVNKQNLFWTCPESRLSLFMQITDSSVLCSFMVQEPLNLGPTEIPKNTYGGCNEIGWLLTNTLYKECQQNALFLKQLVLLLALTTNIQPCSSFLRRVYICNATGEFIPQHMPWWTPNQLLPRPGGIKTIAAPPVQTTGFHRSNLPGQRPNPGIRHFEPAQKHYLGFPATLRTHQRLKMGWLRKLRLGNAYFRKGGWYGERHRNPWQFTIKISD